MRTRWASAAPSHEYHGGFPAIPIRQYGIPFQEDFYMRNRRATWAPAHELPYVQMFQCGKIA